MTKFNLGDHQFRTKGEAREHISALLKSYSVGDRVREHDLIDALLSLHPEADSKRGAGVEYFYVDRDPYNSKCFYIMRVDGTYTDFGTKHCFNGESRTKYVNAFRHTVRDQIFEFKGSQIGDVDHDPPFIHLLEDWAKLNGVILSNGLLTSSRDNKFCEELQNTELARSFADYHKEHARLFMLSPEENRSKGWLAQRKYRIKEEK